MKLRRMMCCGLVELSGLSDWCLGRYSPSILDEIANCHFRSHYARGIGGFRDPDLDRPRARSYRIIVFTEGHPKFNEKPYEYGQKFANFLKEHGLGKVYEVADWGLNLNSGNQIKVWFWEIDHKEFWIQYAEQWKRSEWSETIRDYWAHWDTALRHEMGRQ